jgi:hypothetical protein
VLYDPAMTILRSGACARVALGVLACVATSVHAQQPGAIDPARLTAHVKVLASDEFEGRAPATPGETRTVAYIVDQFRAVGLQPGGDRDGQGGRGWTQDVPLATAEAAGPITASFAVAGTSRPLRQGDDIAARC